MKNFLLGLVLLACSLFSLAQDTTIIHPVDTLPKATVDTTLRIMNLNPSFSVHVDSILNYQLDINKDNSHYFWYLKNAPVGLRINKQGLISFKADKSYFMSGKLKYDYDYKVVLGVQNLNDPKEKIDTTFTITFYNTEVMESKVKPSVNSNVVMEEGDVLTFRVFCEDGSFPIENILTLTSIPISNFKPVLKCGDEFSWNPSYDFVRETDPGKEKTVYLQFIGATKFQMRDTATVKVVVKEALNYPVISTEYNQVVKNIQRYVRELKFTFLQLDKRLKKTKSMRTGFDLTSATTSLAGTILSTSADPNDQRNGKILPSVGLALVPIKEASVPNKMVDQNQASQIRTSIKRLEYMLQDNQLIGERDPDIAKKTTKLKDELKQVQMQLIEVPIEFTNNMTEEELDRYFNSPKVNKKYRLSGK